MSNYAKIGQNEDVLEHISAAQKVKWGDLSSKFSEDDVKWREIFHEGQNELIDQVCLGLQAMLKKQGGTIAM